MRVYVVDHGHVTDVVHQCLGRKAAGERTRGYIACRRVYQNSMRQNAYRSSTRSFAELTVLHLTQVIGGLLSPLVSLFRLSRGGHCTVFVIDNGVPYYWSFSGMHYNWSMTHEHDYNVIIMEPRSSVGDEDYPA